MKNTLTRSFLAALSLLPSFGGVAAQTLSIDSCVARALEHNKSVLSAQLKQQQATFERDAYKAKYFPQINLTAIDFYTTAKGKFTLQGGHLPIYQSTGVGGQYVPDVTPQPDGSYQLNKYADFPSQTLDWKIRNVFLGGVSLLQPIYTGGKLTAANRMAEEGRAMAGENIRKTEAEVIVATHQAYHMLVRAQEMGEVARRYQTMLDELKKNVEAALRHGMRTRHDVLKVQVKLNEAELSVQRADNALQLAQMNLCHYVGLPLHTLVRAVAPSADSISSLPTTLTTAHRPEHALLEHQVALAKQQEKLAHSELLPTANLAASYLYAHGGKLADTPIIDQATATVGLAVTMPLDLFGASSSKVRSAKAAHRIAQMEQEELGERMSLELAQCRNAYDEADTSVRLCTTALQQAEEHVRLSRQQYEVGLEPLSDYLEAQALYATCNSDLVEARCQKNIARVKLLRAAGQLR